jgi:hypothetical protein
MAKLLKKILGPRLNVRILSRKDFIDVQTEEPFSVWVGADGLRYKLASWVLKF